MNAELKPCPFCGGKAVIDSEYTTFFVGGSQYRVYCSMCHAMHTVWQPSEDLAIAAWNSLLEEKQP